MVVFDKVKVDADTKVIRCQFESNLMQVGALTKPIVLYILLMKIIITVD